MKTGVDLIGAFLFFDIIWFIYNTIFEFNLKKEKAKSDEKDEELYSIIYVVTFIVAHVSIFPAGLIFIIYWCQDTLSNRTLL